MAETYTMSDIIKGDSFKEIIFEVLINSVAKDLTNTRIKIDFKKGSKTGTLQKTITVGSGITKTDAVNGKFAIDEFICSFPADTYYYDVQFIDGSEVNTYIEGTLTVIQDVTD